LAFLNNSDNGVQDPVDGIKILPRLYTNALKSGNLHRPVGTDLVKKLDTFKIETLRYIISSFYQDLLS